MAATPWRGKPRRAWECSVLRVERSMSLKYYWGVCSCVFRSCFSVSFFFFFWRVRLRNIHLVLIFLLHSHKRRILVFPSLSRHICSAHTYPILLFSEDHCAGEGVEWGVRIERGGTTLVTQSQPDFSQFTGPHCVLSLNHALIRRKTLPSLPCSFSYLKHLWWSTLSNTVLESR